MAKSENKRMIYLLFGVVTGVLVLYAIVVAPGYHRYMLHLKTSNKTGKLYKIIIIIIIIVHVVIIIHSKASRQQNYQYFKL